MRKQKRSFDIANCDHRHVFWCSIFRSDVRMYSNHLDEVVSLTRIDVFFDIMLNIQAATLLFS